MIDEVLLLLKNQLNSYFASLSLGAVADFPSIDSSGQVKLQADKLNLLLYRLEKEPAIGQQGSPSNPTMNVNLNILFVATVNDYPTSLQHLSHVIQFFQTHRTFDAQNAPEKPKSLGNLIIDIISLSLAEQSELWTMLNVGYLPSVAYQLKTVVFGGAVASYTPPISAIEPQVQPL